MVPGDAPAPGRLADIGPESVTDPRRPGTARGASPSPAGTPGEVVRAGRARTTSARGQPTETGSRCSAVASAPRVPSPGSSPSAASLSTP